MKMPEQEPWVKKSRDLKNLALYKSRNINEQWVQMLPITFLHLIKNSTAQNESQLNFLHEIHRCFDSQE